jgi:hypothetical protein
MPPRASLDRLDRCHVRQTLGDWRSLEFQFGPFEPRGEPRNIAEVFLNQFGNTSVPRAGVLFGPFNHGLFDGQGQFSLHDESHVQCSKNTRILQAGSYARVEPGREVST